MTEQKCIDCKHCEINWDMKTPSPSRLGTCNEPKAKCIVMKVNIPRSCQWFEAK